MTKKSRQDMLAHRDVSLLQHATTLSEREIEVLTGLYDGKSREEIAEELDIEPESVRTYLSRARKKADGAKNTIQLLLEADEDRSYSNYQDLREKLNQRLGDD
ncbi:helix-turn-helix domain-containing protein [Haloparvum sedimenti]|uniref:helix-turn-helix domain-containing protein n=1 Tax=Haloparvum sedimenti TaxID=1678448 RepID=UPI00159EC67B|nr:helix-turn-helix transcriptional regulator [Haloparvum sedimenti]